MADRRRDFRQEILDRLSGNVEGRDTHGAAWDSFAEVDEIDLLHDSLEEHEYPQFYLALKSLIIDPNLSDDEHGMLVHFAYSKNLGQVENEIRSLSETLGAASLRLLEIINDYLAYRAERREEARIRH
jgi:hypothetical protein